MSEHRFQGLRAVLRNALLWGAAWGLTGGAIATAGLVFFAGPGVESLPERLGLAIFGGVGWGIRFGLAGAVVGALFSSIIRFSYRGRRLADINPARFALLGAVVGGVGVPVYLQLMNVLSSGRPIAWGLVLDDAPWAAAFGAAAAAGSILLARRAEALPREPRTGKLPSGERFPGAEPREASRARRDSVRD